MAADAKLKATAASRYAKLEDGRRPFLDRARQCSLLTVPALLPPQGFDASSELPTPYQSLGARGLRTLASKLLLSLFPSVPFFKWQIDDIAKKKLGAKRSEVEEALASRERATTSELDICVFKPAAFLSLQYLLCHGNAIVKIPDEGDERAQVHRLDQFVVRRDAAGNLLEFIIKETLDRASVTEEVQDIIDAVEKDKSQGEKSLDDEPLDIYTHCYLERGKWVVYQEVLEHYIPGTDGSYKKGELPWLVLRLSAQPGEDYGRSYIEEYLGDLDSLEALSETLVEGSAASARIVFLVKPSGVTSLKVVATAKTGDVKSGDANDVTVMQVQKGQDLSVAKSQAEEIANRLSYAFLLHSSVQRKGERVTAEEIRYMASELDDGLGGIYTLFAADYQLPAVQLFEKRMMKRLKPPPLPSDIVHPVIVTGLEAIGRGHDQRNLQAFVKEIVAVLTPEVAMQYLNPLELIKRSAAAYNIDTADLIPTEEQVAEKEQQAQLMQMATHMGPQAINAMGGLGKTALQGMMAQPQAPVAAQ